MDDAVTVAVVEAFKDLVEIGLEVRKIFRVTFMVKGERECL